MMSNYALPRWIKTSQRQWKYMSLMDSVIKIFSNILASWNQLFEKILNKQMLFTQGIAKNKKAQDH